MLIGAGAAAAETPVPLLGASPLPERVEHRFCLYAGLAYSAGAMITVRSPIRREVVADRPYKALRCVAKGDSEGRFHWKEVDPDTGDPFRD